MTDNFTCRVRWLNFHYYGIIIADLLVEIRLIICFVGLISFIVNWLSWTCNFEHSFLSIGYSCGRFWLLQAITKVVNWIVRVVKIVFNAGFSLLDDNQLLFFWLHPQFFLFVLLFIVLLILLFLIRDRFAVRIFTWIHSKDTSHYLNFLSVTILNLTFYYMRLVSYLALTRTSFYSTHLLLGLGKL